MMIITVLSYLIGPFTHSVFKDPTFVGSENRIVWTHWKWPSDTRIRKFEETDRNRRSSIFIRHSSWKMKDADKFCMISLWSFWRQIDNSLSFWKSDRASILQMTFWHSHHRNGTLKSDRLSACFQFSEPRIGSLKSDRVNGPWERLLNVNWWLCSYSVSKPNQMILVWMWNKLTANQV